MKSFLENENGRINPLKYACNLNARKLKKKKMD